MATTKVTETEEQKRNREAIEAIAKNIGSLATAVRALLTGPVKRKTLIVLLAASSGQSQRTIDSVLTAISEMDKDWLK